MNYPLISVVIATLNSEKTLPKTLESIKNQTYPSKKIEVLVIDAGSTDNTKKIAKRYSCKFLYSSKIELTYAKQLGFLTAKGKYLMFLDSDEVLENTRSFFIKYKAFQSSSRVKMVMTSGYKTPAFYSEINHYVNEFGDPFSYFIYRESKYSDQMIKEMSKKYNSIIVKEDNNSIIFDFSKIKHLPLIELWAGGCMVDLTYLKKYTKQIKQSPDILPHLFYLLTKQNKLLAVTKNDNTIHYSSESLRKYLKKIASRVKFNIFLTSMGKGGYSGREKYSATRSKKNWFIPYSFSLILPIIDSIHLSITRRKTIYLIHWLLTFYTASMILYYYFLKLIGITPEIKKYAA